MRPARSCKLSIMAAVSITGSVEGSTAKEVIPPRAAARLSGFPDVLTRVAGLYPHIQQAGGKNIPLAIDFSVTLLGKGLNYCQ